MLHSTDITAEPAPGRGLRPAEMTTISDLCCILDHALVARAEGAGSLPDLLGLSGTEIAALRDAWLPWAVLPDLDVPLGLVPDEQRAVATLILWRGGSAAAEARWLAPIIARRALEPRHLWEDLGLPSRAALSAMISRHLPGLAKANGQNMRWKKFLYRQICAEEGFALCLAPSCGECAERAACFAPD